MNDIAYLQSHQEDDALNPKDASVHVVAHEDVAVFDCLALTFVWTDPLPY
jgi:hypothetical protein